MRNLPVINDKETREVLGALYRSAELLGGLEFKSQVIDASIDGTGFNFSKAAELVNEKLDEIRAKAGIHRSGAGTGSLSFDSISDADFVKSLENPLLLRVDPSVPKKVKKITDRQPVRSFDGIQTKDFISSICKPSVAF